MSKMYAVYFVFIAFTGCVRLSASPQYEDFANKSYWVVEEGGHIYVSVNSVEFGDTNVVIQISAGLGTNIYAEGWEISSTVLERRAGQYEGALSAVPTNSSLVLAAKVNDLAGSLISNSIVYGRMPRLGGKLLSEIDMNMSLIKQIEAISAEHLPEQDISMLIAEFERPQFYPVLNSGNITADTWSSWSNYFAVTFYTNAVFSVTNPPVASAQTPEEALVNHVRALYAADPVVLAYTGYSAHDIEFASAWSGPGFLGATECRMVSRARETRDGKDYVGITYKRRVPGGGVDDLVIWQGAVFVQTNGVWKLAPFEFNSAIRLDLSYSGYDRVGVIMGTNQEINEAIDSSFLPEEYKD